MDLYINPSTGDIELTNHTMRFTKNNAELTTQRIRTSLLTYRGEWSFNINEGVPYLENQNNPIQLIGRGSPDDFDPYVKTIIKNKPFVQNITDYSSTHNKQTGQLRISFNAMASDRENIVDEISINI